MSVVRSFIHSFLQTLQEAKKRNEALTSITHSDTAYLPLGPGPPTQRIFLTPQMINSPLPSPAAVDLIPPDARPRIDDLYEVRLRDDVDQPGRGGVEGLGVGDEGDLRGVQT